MCTVLFISKKDKLFFASLRDENPKRPQATAPEIYTIDDINFLSPKDSLAGGTWIGITGSKKVIILLNGGFENHHKKNNYLKSRGLIVSDLLISANPVADWVSMDLSSIEPFTLIVWSGENLFQLVWDGIKKHKIELDDSVPYLWSSSTLYNSKIKKVREEFFKDWIATHPSVSKSTVLDFFRSFTENENGFIMHRNENLKTVSYSFIELNENNFAVMDYYDFLNHQHSSKTIGITAKNKSLHQA
ncbi:hypothetical protein GALL_46390 [mine drainage metagenome]|uniref:Transport and Golgi organization protein 2 n=1 Tax=mine drainage metagenome TaxID=410659 RepID=A0A1J5T022_9ZZZZ